MRLLAIGDLHLRRRKNWEAFLHLPPHSDDWLIVTGDVSESVAQFRAAMAWLAQQFGRVFWTPGNHDLWTLPHDEESERGEAKYRQLAAICREQGVVTPEDPYQQFPGGPLIAPIFTLYDYSFRPAHVPLETAVAWAEESGVVCTDELLLHPDPYPSRQAWCAARCRLTERRLGAAAAQGPLILANHFPLRQDLVFLPRIPRFSIWCGTRRTESWHTQFPVTAVAYGHLHIRANHWQDGVRFVETSLGYPRQWHPELGIEAYLRQIWPPPP